MGLYLRRALGIKEQETVVAGDEALYVLREAETERAFWPSGDFAFVTETPEFRTTVERTGQTIEVSAYDALTGDADRHWLLVAFRSDGQRFPISIPIE